MNNHCLRLIKISRWALTLAIAQYAPTCYAVVGLTSPAAARCVMFVSVVTVLATYALVLYATASTLTVLRRSFTTCVLTGESTAIHQRRLDVINNQRLTLLFAVSTALVLLTTVSVSDVLYVHLVFVFPNIIASTFLLIGLCVLTDVVRDS